MEEYDEFKNSFFKYPYDNYFDYFQVSNDYLYDIKVSSINKNNYSNDNNQYNDIKNCFFPIFYENNKYNELNNNIILEKSNEYTIIEFIKIIGDHKNGIVDDHKNFKDGEHKNKNNKIIIKNVSSEFITEIGKGLYISGGIDGKLYIYDPLFNKKGEIQRNNDNNDWIYSIVDITNKNDDEIKLMLTSKQGLCIFILNPYIFELQIQEHSVPKNSCNLSIKLNENDFLVCNENGCIYYSDIFNKSNKYGKKKVFDISFKGGIFINDNLIFLSSNRATPGGEDILILYDPINNKKIYEIKNYSFILSNYGLELIPKKGKLKILLCACKKYFKEQKNGIL